MTRYFINALSFVRHEAIGGLMLVSAAILALVLVNAGAAPTYENVLNTPLGFFFGPIGLEKTLLHWINDGLMAIFFFLIGMEVKREFIVGELSTPRRAALPMFAAIGGMAIPALIYAAINFNSPQTLGGWAIPAATDIAFALAVLVMLGSRIPPALKVFLLAVAIIDDVGAIIVIAIFYTSKLSVTALALGLGGVVVLGLLNIAGVRRISPYVLVGIFVWACVLKSGIHATLAGVVTGLAIPLFAKDSTDPHAGPLEAMEHWLHPWVTFGILPAFAFANAGVSLQGLSIETLQGLIPMGIIAGLVIGKPVGVLLMSWLAVRSGACELPEGITWSHIFGAGCLAGIGFTMSLFIGMLAFPDPAQMPEVRIGVLTASLLAALLGIIWLLATSKTKAATGSSPTQ